MSTAVTTQRLCVCGCQRTVQGKASYFSAACRQRVHRAGPEKLVYPLYTSATERLNRCDVHGEVYTEHSYQFQGRSGAGWGAIGVASGGQPNYGLMTWMGECSKCTQAARERLERLKPKPAVNPCANRQCECLKSPPLCHYCHQPMALLPTSLPGMHEWACVVVPAVVEVRPPAGDKMRREMAEPERQRAGEHHRSMPGGMFMTAWRE